MKAIAKFFKFIFWTVVVLVLLAVVAVLTIPWWIGPTVTGTANYAVPKIVKTGFTLKEFGFNQYKGTLGLGALTLANPEGFDKENCLELDALSVKFDPVSCFTKKVHIEKIELDGLRLIVDFPQAANFQKIGENAQESCGGECEKEKEEEEAKTEDDKDATKVVIDVIEFKNLKVTYGAAPIIIPDFTLTDIGKDSGGASLEEAWDTTFKAVCDKLGIVVGAVIDAGKVVIDTGVETAGAVIDIGKETANAAIEAIGNVDAAGAVDTVKEGAASAVDAAKEGAGRAIDTVTEGLGAASDAVGSGLNAVGDGAGAAVDAVKGLFK